ncbi:MYB DNA-binding domain-containing protein, variant 4 [Blastomyces dermatitidis ER-3]|nr:MYB DNA-binding domain-containing protein, variant 3 [Blastomyces gilchristii SLH14081]XP_031578637.1 MYB DNA-binding domain-containing protein, variant 4 [Blastomyces gilchristii SLH14081]XP_045279721.1 MYB DNA-binding domain-containing protein, variant 3 [Blastomyces dermatitidis ER-3]XP_045279722.1 MYB DNA-binding domain-containing protein, variant 4 [Blastomyces dermatitidis ER-3]KMW66874.1 MYB DNA-binding domain-containing protein, variant 2 [Blastomyces dermatitidis ATCC 18188]KMW6687
MNWPVFVSRPPLPNMSSPPTSKRIKTTVASNTPTHPLNQQQQQQPHPFTGPGPFESASMVPISTPVPAPAPAAPNPRKRREGNTTTTSITGAPTAPEPTVKKKGRTNTPWTAEEEQRLKTMRDAGNTWSEIAKTFPLRTEGSVKKHWYKDMHYAEFTEEESITLRDAIKEYESSKWKVIGQKIGKPAKACEQYAKEHFKHT